MVKYDVEYIVNEEGTKKKVILNYEDYINILSIIEDIEDSELIKQTIDEPEVSLEDYKRKAKIV